MGFSFFFNSILLGIGLAMDAFSVSLANGLNEPNMKKGRICLIAGTFAIFQAIMPMLGWICVHTLAEKFSVFYIFIPWIALILLLIIGVGMIKEGCSEKCDECTSCVKLGKGTLILQGIATSIDALSVGFTIADYNYAMAFLASFTIAAVTFFICCAGVEIGKKFGTRLSGKSSLLGGCILVFIGVEIFLKGIFFS